jgi:hypothetical protein
MACSSLNFILGSYFATSVFLKTQSVLSGSMSDLSLDELRHLFKRLETWTAVRKTDTNLLRTHGQIYTDYSSLQYFTAVR